MDDVVSKDALESHPPFEEHANIWRYTYRIRSHEVSPGGGLTLSSLFHLMQDGASSHARSLGISVNDLMQKGYTWVLSRLILELFAPLPKWEDQLTLQTWPSGNKGPFALRNFVLLDKDGQKLAAALSGWLVIDMDSRRPQRIGPFSKILRPIEGHHILPPNLNKISLPKQIIWKRRFSVRRDDLDINQHVNNVSYITWLLETVPDTIVSEMSMQTIHLNFMGEAKRKDKVISTIEAVDHNKRKAVFLHQIVCEKDGRELLRAESQWLSNKC